MNYEVTPIYNKNKNIFFKIEDFKPEVSIITPYYNSKEYIEDTMISVLNQTFPWFEWIIVDDGSTDKESIELIEQLKKKDKRIKVFHKKNEGLAATRDFGAKKASKFSKYLLFLDDDDLIENNYLECLYYALETNKEASFAYTNTVGFGEQNYLWDKKMNIRAELKENLLVATALIRKKDFFEVGGYGTKEKGINEDWVFWIKMFSKSKIPLKVNYFGFWYRRKKVGELKKSLSNKEKTQKLLDQYKKDVDYDIAPIEYPMNTYDWDDVHRVQNPFKCISKINSNKINIIMIMPHLVMGGADKFNIDFLKGLDKKYSVTAIFTNISENEWICELKKYVSDYYILPSFLDRKYWHLFIDYIINKNDTKLIFNTNSVYGYMVLPYIKSKHPTISIMDYVHMEEWYNRNGGYSRDSSAVASCIDRTYVCNEASEKVLVNYFGRNKDDVGTVYIGVDEKKFKNDYSNEELLAIKKEYNIPTDKKIVTFISRIAEQKRPFLLAEIIKKFTHKYDDCLFLICGDGPLLDKLQNVIEKYNINNVMFLGKISNTKEIYAISDCTLNCSIKEGLALTTYESLSMGVPVVSSNVGGQAEIINKDVGELIELNQKEEDVSIHKYNPSEIDNFVVAIRKVIDENDKYKSNCRKRVLSGFTIDSMNKKMNSIIEELIKNPSKKNNLSEDIALELLNQYLLETNDEYNYTLESFNKKYYEDSLKSEYKNKLYNLKNSISNKIDKLSIKLHIYNEASIVKKIFYYIIKTIYLIIKLPIVIIIRIIKMFSKVISKIRGKK